MDTAKRRVARSCRVEVIADAPIASVWRVVADVTRTGGFTFPGQLKRFMIVRGAVSN
jgi:hypothetical protein